MTSRRSRSLAVICAAATVACAGAPARVPGTPTASTLSAADSALVGRILLAEDRRDSTDVALAEGAHHADARVRSLAQRAKGRIGNPRFVARDGLLAATPTVAWPEPAWRLRYRALTAPRDDCSALRIALADSAWPVRLRAMDLVAPVCAPDDALARTLGTWIDALPADASRRASNGVSWHAAVHAAIALARMRPAEARERVRALSAHRQWQVRTYAARAAGILSDSLTLRARARGG